MGFPRHALALACLFIFSGCVTTNDYDTLRADVNQMRKDYFELRRDLAEARKDSEQTRQQAAGAAREESFQAIRESQTALLAQVGEVSKEVQVLRGRFDENKFFMDRTLKEQSTDRELLRSQLAGLEGRVKELSEKVAKLSDSAASSKPPQESPETKETEPRKDDPKAVKEKETAEDDPVKAYEAAYSLFEEKHYKEAREKLNSFIRKFPRDRRAGNAQFWIAETYFAEKDYEGAILGYEALVKNYTSSEKIPSALYKQGLAFIELGDRKTAKVIFQRLIEKYPDARETDMAKKKLAETDKKTVKPKQKR